MNIYILYKISSSEPIVMNVLTWSKVDGFVNSFIRGQNTDPPWYYHSVGTHIHVDEQGICSVMVNSRADPVFTDRP